MQQHAFINRKYEIRKYQPPNLNTETHIEHVFSPCNFTVNSVTMESNIFMHTSWFQLFLPFMRSVCNCLCPIYRIVTKWQNKHTYITPLKTKRRPLYLKTQSVPRCKHFSSGYKNQPVYAVSGTSRCLFSDKYKTHKYSVGRVCSC